MPQRRVLIHHIHFRLILATAVNSVDYRRKSIQFPYLRICRKRQRLPSNGFIESAPEHPAPVRFFSQCASDKTLAFVRALLIGFFQLRRCRELFDKQIADRQFPTGQKRWFEVLVAGETAL